MGYCIGSLKILCEGYPEILFREANNPGKEPVTLRHFHPFNKWIDSGFPQLVDETTGDFYSHEEANIKRFKCLVLVIATPITQSIGLILNIINRVGLILSSTYSWTHDKFEERPLCEMMKEFSDNILSLALTPIILVGMELAAIYGLVKPFDGGKLYASFERLAYGKEFLAPCFQPNRYLHTFNFFLQK